MRGDHTLPNVLWSSNCSGGEEKGENAFGGLGSSLGVIPGRFHSKGGTAAKSSRLRRSGSGLAAECVFRLFHCGWVKIPNTFAYLPFFLSKFLLVLLVWK